MRSCLPLATALALALTASACGTATDAPNCSGGIVPTAPDDGCGVGASPLDPVAGCLRPAVILDVRGSLLDATDCAVERDTDRIFHTHVRIDFDAPGGDAWRPCTPDETAALSVPECDRET